LLCRGGHTQTLAEFRTVQNGGKAGRVKSMDKKKRKKKSSESQKIQGEFIEQRAPHNSSFLSSTETETIPTTSCSRPNYQSAVLYWVTGLSRREWVKIWGMATELIGFGQKKPAPTSTYHAGWMVCGCETLFLRFILVSDTYPLWLTLY
jgi:hypothetical protein